MTASLQLATGRPYGNPQHTLLFAYWAQLCLHPPTATTEVRHPTYHADTGRDVPPYVLNRRCNYYENFSFPCYSKFSNFFNDACTSVLTSNLTSNRCNFSRDDFSFTTPYTMTTKNESSLTNLSLFIGFNVQFLHYNLPYGFTTNLRYKISYTGI